MSYQIIDMQEAFWSAVHKADEAGDYKSLYALADIAKRQDFDEVAEQLRKQAMKIRRDEWAYDEHRDNNL